MHDDRAGLDNGLGDAELYRCTESCPQGVLHDPSGCEGCHDPDAPFIVKFTTWETSYCQRCARQLRMDGHELSKRGRQLPDEQHALSFE